MAYGKLAEWIVRAFGQIDCLVGCVPANRFAVSATLLPANLHHELIDEAHWVGALPAFASTLRKREGLVVQAL
ncbi:hypothetical protein [Paracoccus saliphilus]|uniref:Uncharacterized protein n=1 Tax=Paracoccus saliphilus TaxID=405559 RepID=A0ABY7SEU2_9RHOB|nr:hypothetical protein [Paracoccus saliphilus]WCR05548.1 hypothetical protein JHX88_22085 [Paracoccus saliphilus]